MLPSPGARIEFGIGETRVANQRARRRPLRSGVDDGDVAVTAGHDLELGVLALTAGRGASRIRAGGRFPVDPLQHFGERHADRLRCLAGITRRERRGETGKGGQASGIGRLMATQSQRLAVRLAHHVQQTTQRQQGELADRPRSRVHLQREGRDLDRRGAAGPCHRRDRAGSSNSTASAVSRSWPSQRGRPRSRDRGPGSASRC